MGFNLKRMFADLIDILDRDYDDPQDAVELLEQEIRFYKQYAQECGQLPKEVH